MAARSISTSGTIAIRRSPDTSRSFRRRRGDVHEPADGHRSAVVRCRLEGASLSGAARSTSSRSIRRHEQSLPMRIARLTIPALDEGPHLNYAIQWFGFAAVALVGAGFVVRQARADAGRGRVAPSPNPAQFRAATPADEVDPDVTQRHRPQRSARPARCRSVSPTTRSRQERERRQRAVGQQPVGQPIDAPDASDRQSFGRGGCIIQG